MYYQLYFKFFIFILIFLKDTASHDKIANSENTETPLKPE